MKGPRCPTCAGAAAERSESAYERQRTRHVGRGAAAQQSLFSDVAFGKTADPRQVEMFAYPAAAPPPVLEPPPLAAVREAARLLPVLEPVTPRKKGRRTFDQARAELFEHLAAQGWDVRATLKVPWAASPNGRVRLWFKAQSVHYTEGNAHSAGNAHSTGLDIRDMTPAAFVAAVEHIAPEADERRYSVAWVVTVDHPERRGPSYPAVRPGTEVDYQRTFRRRPEAEASFRELASGADDSAGEFVSLVEVFEEARGGDRVRVESIRRSR